MTLNATVEMLRRIQALRLQESPALKEIQSIAESARQASVRQQSQFTNIFQDIAKSTSLADRIRQESPTLEIMQSIVESLRRPALGGLPATRMIQDLKKSASLLNHIRQESPALKEIQSVAESARQASVRQQSQFTNIFQDIAKSASLADRIRQESPSLEIMQSIVESLRRPALGILPATRMIQDLKKSARLLNHIRQESPALKAMQGIAESAHQASVRQHSQFTNIVQDIANSAKLVDSLLQESNAMKALRQISNLPFNSIVREMSFPEPKIPDNGQTELESFSQPHFSIDQEVELEVQRELRGSNNYNRLPDRAKSYVMNFLLYFLLPMITNLLSSVVIDTTILQTELTEYKMPREVKSYIRRGMHGFDKEILKGYRVVTGSAVRLRRTPSLKSEIVALLPLGTLIEVLNESNRSWLQGEVDVEGQKVVGWVSRRYTKKFN